MKKIMLSLGIVICFSNTTSAFCPLPASHYLANCTKSFGKLYCALTQDYSKSGKNQEKYLKQLEKCKKEACPLLYKDAFIIGQSVQEVNELRGKDDLFEGETCRGYMRPRPPIKLDHQESNPTEEKGKSPKKK